jgi:hypothetical protein
MRNFLFKNKKQMEKEQKDKNGEELEEIEDNREEKKV